MNYTHLIGVLLNGLFQVGYLAVVGGFIYYQFVVLPGRIAKRFSDFAAKHDLVFGGPKAVVPDYVGFLPGKSSYATRGVDSKTKRQTSIFRLVFDPPERRDAFYRTVVAMEIQPTGVHIFVNSRINDVKEQLDLAKSQRYVAEGDFGKYFDLYMPAGARIKALSLFAPDVLSLIMAHYGNFDMEIVNNRLYLYSYSAAMWSDNLEELYNLTADLASALDDNQPVKLNAASTSEAPAESAVTALEHRKSNLWLATIAVIMAVVVGPSILGLLIDKAPQAVGPLLGGGLLMIIVLPALLLIYALRIDITGTKKVRQYEKDRQAFAADHPIIGVKPKQG